MSTGALEIPPMPLEEALGRFIRYAVTGSTVIDPGGEHADRDYICLSSDAHEDAPGWHRKTKGYPSGFRVFASCGVDLIVTSEPVAYEKFVLATELCTRLGLSNKADRVLVFRAILYDETPAEIKCTCSTPVTCCAPGLSGASAICETCGGWALCA